MLESLAMSAVMMLPRTDIPEYQVPKVYQAFEKCVSWRESRRKPDAVNPTGKYRGMYQMDHAIASGATHWIVDWLGTWHRTPKKYAAALRATPVNKWPRQVQTAVFVVTLNGHDKNERWSGAAHWYYSGSRCNGLVKR